VGVGVGTTVAVAGSVVAVGGGVAVGIIAVAVGKAVAIAVSAGSAIVGVGVAASPHAVASPTTTNKRRNRRLPLIASSPVIVSISSLSLLLRTLAVHRSALQAIIAVYPTCLWCPSVFRRNRACSDASSHPSDHGTRLSSRLFCTIESVGYRAGTLLTISA
jgi:hypothetical protein